jgi:2-keto-4-pentenoate hydratase
MNATVDRGRAEKAASLLLEARRTGKLLEPFAEALKPKNAAEVYAIQDLTLAGLGPVGGWKAGPPGGEDPAWYNTLPAVDIHPSPAKLPGVIPFNPEIEVEIAVVFGRDLPKRATPYAREDVAAAIASVNPAIEVIGSRFTSRTAADALSGLADLRSNAATVVGPALKDWRKLDFARVDMELAFDGKKAAEVSGGASTETALGILTNLVNHATSRTGGVRAGQVVITGARIRPTAVPKGTKQIVADVTGLGRVTLNL